MVCTRLEVVILKAPHDEYSGVTWVQSLGVGLYKEVHHFFLGWGHFRLIKMTSGKPQLTSKYFPFLPKTVS